MDINKFMKNSYGLKGNPFKDYVARAKWLQTWVNRDQELKAWKKTISSSGKFEKNHISFIIGDYGTGKTLSLLKIVEESQRQDTLLTAYFNFQAEEKSRKPGLDLMLRLLKGFPYDRLKKGRSPASLKRAINSLPDDLDEVKRVTMKMYFGDGPERNLAQYFLSGQIVPTKSDLKMLGILRKIQSVEIAKEYLAGALWLAKKLGYSTLLIAMDEFEYLFSLIPKPQRTIYLALLRGLYDFPVGLDLNIGEIANIALFIATSQDGWRKLNDMEKEEMGKGGPIQPLLSRVDRKYTLKSFTRLETEELIKKRLRYDRISERYRRQPLIPFDKSFVGFIFANAKGELRHTIFLCSHILDAGLEKGVKLLDDKFAALVLKERNL